MPCDLTAAALVEARRKMTIKAALFEHALFFPNMLDSRGFLQLFGSPPGFLQMM